MKEQPFTYLISIVVMLCLTLVWSTDTYAQRARKHREGILKADSIRALHVTDSLALLDTLSIREQRVKELEAPVDTMILAKENDSIQQQMPAIKMRKQWIPDSRKSTWLALAIPGAGQIYNRKFWKLPIIYGGFIGCTYALTWNSKMYKDYSQAYQDIMSDNPNNDSYMDFVGAGITKEDVQKNPSQYQNRFKNGKDVYRRQRDLSIFCFIGVYLLSVIDAYVDAELSDFDISKDLGMTWEPAVFNDAYRGMPQGVGLRCNIKF